MRPTKNLLLLSLVLLPVQGVWAVDADNDGSDSYEEGLAGTSDNDPTQRPYWWKTFNGVASFGESVSGAGDVNGDGVPDLIVGAPLDDSNGFASGFARVFSGLDGSILYTFDGDSKDMLGRSVSGAGDVNRDGYADLIVGASYVTNGGTVTRPGYARVFSGANGSILYTFNGDNAAIDLGVSVSGAGDVNGDGYPDLIVGAPDANINGQPVSGSESARVFSGATGSILYTFNGSGSDGFGEVSGAGDVNGDGVADLIVGATGDWSNQSGFVRVFSGANGGILYTFNGDSQGDNLGRSVSDAGDVNGDGHADLIAAGNYFSRVYSGLNGSILYTINGGSSVRNAGDVNGDGVADLIVGAPGYFENWGEPGRTARVFSGANGSLLYSFNSHRENFGYSVSGAGDMDGDGLADLIVGDPSDWGGPSGYARAILSSDLMNDSDLDYRLNAADNCPLNSNPKQADHDGDGIGNKCDPDYVPPVGC